MERDVSGGGGKVPVIVAAVVALTGLIALVTGAPYPICRTEKQSV